MFPSLIFISEGGKGLFIRKRRPIVSPVAGPADDRHHQECSNKRHQYQDREPMRRLQRSMSPKKLYRLYREERLTVRKRGGRKRALGTRAHTGEFSLRSSRVRCAVKGGECAG